MKKYWVYFKAQWQDTLEYRGDVSIYALTNAIMPLMGLFIWLAASGSGAQLAFSKPELIIYFLLIAVVNLLTSSWGAWFVAESINSGAFSKYLIKPFSLIDDFAVNNITEKTFKLIVLLIVMSILGVFLLKDSNLIFTISPVSILLFLISLCMSAVIAFLLDICVGMTTFWFHDVDFLNSFFALANSFFSGKVVPIVFLPAFLSSLAFYLPFRYMLSFPVEVFLNKVQGKDLLLGFLMQIFWLVLVLVLYKLLYKKGLKKYQGYGL